MTCMHFGLRRKFVSYLEGTISADGAKRLEKHLRDCEYCRAMFVRLRTGHEFARQLRPFESNMVPDGMDFDVMMTKMGGLGRERRPWARMWERWSDAMTTPRAVQVLIGLMIVQLAILGILGRKVLIVERNSAFIKTSSLDYSQFRPLSIPELQANTVAHVVTEGYVSDVYFDEEEKTMHFKLAQIPHGSDIFIMCEIMNRSGIRVPYRGSLVRVYGISRYDAQTGREYHEVNPVLNIDVLKQ